MPPATAAPPQAKPTLWDRIQDAWLHGTAIVLGLFMLMSTAGTAIALAALLLSTLLLSPRKWWALPRSHPVTWAGLALFAYIAVHTLVMSQRSDAPWPLAPQAVIGKYQELWLLPILLVWFGVSGKREVFWRALLVGAVVYAGVHWLAQWGVHAVSPEFLAQRRISAGLGLLGVAWIALAQAPASPRPWAWRLVSLGLALTVLFAMDGRTGHVVLLLLAALAGWIYGGRRWRWILCVVLPAAVVAGAMGSKAVQGRMTDTLSIARTATTQEEITSASIRKEYYQKGLTLALAHPWSGVGLGNIGPQFYASLLSDPHQAEHNAVFANSPFSKPSNLHNEYLMQWAGAGLLALLLFGLWLLAPLLSTGLPAAARAGVIGLVAMFAVGCLFNSWLLDFTEGHVYTVLMAWLLAARPPAPGTA